MQGRLHIGEDSVCQACWRRINKPALTYCTIIVPSLINSRIIEENPRRQGYIFVDINKGYDFMTLVAGFVIHIKLTIMVPATGIIVVCCSAVDQLVETIDVFQFNVVSELISKVQLCGIRIELFSVQPIGCGAKVAT